MLVLSPDGSTLAFNSNEGLFIRAMDDTEPRLVPGTEGPFGNPFFSPDGAWIGFFSPQDDQLKKIRVGGGSPVSLTSTDNLQGASWIDDEWIVFGNTSGIFRVSSNGGDPELLIGSESTAGDIQLWDPQQLPDGSILYTERRGQVFYIMIETPGLDDGQELFPGERAVYLPSGHLVVTDVGSAATMGALFVRSFDPATRSFGGPVPIEEGAWFVQGKTQFAVSPSGTLAYAIGNTVGSSNAETILVMADRNGGIEQLDVEPAQYRGPRVSPDGTQLAVEIIGDNGRSSIWVYDLTGSRAFRPLLGAGSNMRPIWTPDGERLTFASDRDGEWGIYWQAADGSGVAERLTTVDGGGQHWPDSWSADGQTLAFTRIGGSIESIQGQDIWTVTLDETGQAGEPEVFVSPQAGGAAFSPDGEWLAYRSTDSALGPTNQVHVQPFPKTGEIHAVTDQGGSYPAWSSDGSMLFYRRPANAGNTDLTIGSVEVTTGASFAWGNETAQTIPGGVAFFGFRDYDPMPDGERLATAVAIGAAGPVTGPITPSIHIARNWIELVLERVPID